MADVTNQYMRLTYVDDSTVSRDIDIRLPVFGYESDIVLPFDLAKDSAGRFTIFDSGAGADTFDVRRCRCSCVLDSTAQSALMAAFKDDSTKGRARSVVMTLYAGGSGFFPFGPDKGDVGPWTCSMVIGESAAGDRPYKYFKTDFTFTNTGAFAAYSIPAATEAGPVTLAGISGIRYPAGWFTADLSQGQYVTNTPGGTAYYRDRGVYADGHLTRATFNGSPGKIGALVHALVDDVRATETTLTVPAGPKPFGASKGDGPFTVRVINDVLTIRHNRHNDFSLELAMALKVINPGDPS